MTEPLLDSDFITGLSHVAKALFHLQRRVH